MRKDCARGSKQRETQWLRVFYTKSSIFTFLVAFGRAVLEKTIGNSRYCNESKSYDLLKKGGTTIRRPF